MMEFSFTILDFIEKSNKAQTVDELFAFFQNALSQCGFDRIVFSMLQKRSNFEGIDLPNLMLNYPADWATYYFENKLEQIDPVTQYIMCSNTPFTWDSLENHISITVEQKNIMNLSREAGLNNGIGIPFHGPYGELSAMGIASSEKNIDTTPTSLSIIHLLSVQFHTAYMQIASKPNGPQKQIHLTPREREIMLWCIKGKSNSVIADILQISEHGVKFHIQNIMKKLDASSRITAVVKAIRLGLISP
jgi:DNA-binding CsgD family transcriptional regulator